MPFRIPRISVFVTDDTEVWVQPPPRPNDVEFELVSLGGSSTLILPGLDVWIARVAHYSVVGQPARRSNTVLVKPFTQKVQILPDCSVSIQNAPRRIRLYPRFCIHTNKYQGHLFLSGRVL